VTGANAGWLDRLSERQVAVAVIVGALGLYLPFAGSYGLWDPWETHYGEVARQMLERGDYISLWWPGSPLDAEHFWSKPVLSFWLMSIGMKAAGLASGGGGDPGELALSFRAEWALRTPFCLMGVLGIYGVYLCTSRFVSRRAGLIAAVATATMPLYSLVARQAMTDMAFVGPMTMALSLGALALFDDRDDPLPRRAFGRMSWPHHGLFYGTLALFAATVVPQLLVDALQLDFTLNAFRRSATVPGIVLMSPYVVGFAAFVLLAAKTRTRAPFYLYIAGILCGLAMLAKGLAGLGLPVIIFLSYLLFTWSWKRLDRPQMYYAILVAMLACAVVTFPWHTAMLLRHGRAFWEELYGDNHWRRMVLGRHGDRGTFEYFLRQLGYAALPWLAVAPAALVTMAARRVSAATTDARRQGLFWFGAIWFVAGYTLVSLSVTKFHHYILAALPGLAIAVGCFIDDLLHRRDTRAFATTALIGVPLLALATYDLVSARQSAQHFLWLFSYDYINSPRGRPWPDGLDFAPAIIGFAAAFAACTAALAWRRVQRPAAAALCACAMAFTFFLLDGYMKKVTAHWTQKGLIATYYRTRASPDERLVAWQMYWRGETFYTKNEIYVGPREKRTVFLGDKHAENLKDWLAKNRGHRHFFVVERSRFNQLRDLLPDETRASLKVIDETNTKFYMAQADL